MKMAPHSYNATSIKRRRTLSVSSVESAVASTSKLSADSSFMAPLARFMARGDTMSSVDSNLSVASTASIQSDRSRSYNATPVKRGCTMSFSSVESAVASTSKLSADSSFMGPLARFMARVDTMSSVDSNLSLASTAYIRSDRSRRKSRSRSWSWFSSSSRSRSRSRSRSGASRSRSPLRPKRTVGIISPKSGGANTRNVKKTPASKPLPLVRDDTVSSVSSLASTVSIMSESSICGSVINSPPSPRARPTTRGRPCKKRSVQIPTETRNSRNLRSRKRSRSSSWSSSSSTPSRSGSPSSSASSSRSRSRSPRPQRKTAAASVPRRADVARVNLRSRTSPRSSRSQTRSKSSSRSVSRPISRSSKRPEKPSRASAARGERTPGKSATKTSVSTSGKVTKRRKAPRLTMTKKKQINPARKAAVEKVLREEATSNNFILSDLRWSDWKQVIRRNLPQDNNHSWERRSQDYMGYRRKRIASNINDPAVYEFAVLTPEKQKVPVLGSVSMGMKGRHWESAMLSKPKLREQIDRVLRRGCKLYARRASFSARDMPSIYEKSPVERKRTTKRSRVSTAEAVHELRGLMLRVNDYAWRDHYDIESRTYSHRPLTVDGVKLSD